MALVSFQFKVGEDPVEIFPPDTDGASIIIRIGEGDSKSVYLGGPKVSRDTGFLYNKSDPPLCLIIGPNETLYACAEKSVYVYVLATLNV